MDPGMACLGLCIAEIPLTPLCQSKAILSRNTQRLDKLCTCSPFLRAKDDDQWTGLMSNPLACKDSCTLSFHSW